MRQMNWYFFTTVLLLYVLPGCGELETNYFRGRVNQATQEAVAHRYGSPHHIDTAEDGGSVWTYFDRGSATSGFTGYARSSYCRAYLLTLDQHGVLRDWREENCGV